MGIRGYRRFLLLFSFLPLERMGRFPACSRRALPRMIPSSVRNAALVFGNREICVVGGTIDIYKIFPWNAAKDIIHPSDYVISCFVIESMSMTPRPDGPAWLIEYHSAR
jgi:hypothetical protein